MDYINFLDDQLLEDIFDDDIEVIDFIDFGFPRRFSSVQFNLFMLKYIQYLHTTRVNDKQMIKINH